MKRTIFIVFFLVTTLVVNGSATGQEVIDQIPACTDNEITLTVDVLRDQIADFDNIVEIIEKGNDDDLPDLIADTEALQTQWWKTDLENIPKCGVAVQLATQYGHALDELLIMLLFVDADMTTESQTHYVIATNLKNDIEAMITSLPTAHVESVPVEGVTVIANTQVNLRGGPGTNYPVSGSLSANQPVEAIARNAEGDWLVLDTGAWIASWVVTVEGNAILLPIRGAPQLPAQSSEDSSDFIPPAGFYYRPSDNGSSCKTEPGTVVCVHFDDGYRWLVQNAWGLTGWISEIIDGYDVVVAVFYDGTRYAHLLGTSYVKGPYTQ